jgi:hypothetical protein
VRRTQCRKASKEDRQLIKGQRYLILGNQENLDADARSKLDRVLEANEAISAAYILKEQFRWLFSYRRLGWAMRALGIQALWQRPEGSGFTSASGAL